MSFFAELRRRNVIRMAGLYLVGAWIIVQVAETLLPAFEVPAWVLRAIVIVLALGFFPALIFAWIFELTPEGLKRDHEVDRAQSIAPQTGQRMNVILAILLALVLVYFAVDRFVISPTQGALDVAASLHSGRSSAGVSTAITQPRSIAVLPFENLSADRNNEYFADGVAEELLNQLAQLPGLKVAGRTSSFAFKDHDEDMREIGRKLGVAYLVEGSIRRSQDRVRITAQLVKAADGFHVWSQTYDRELTDIFAVQDEISGAITAALKLNLLGAAGPAFWASADVIATWQGEVPAPTPFLPYETMRLDDSGLRFLLVPRWQFTLPGGRPIEVVEPLPITPGQWERVRVIERGRRRFWVDALGLDSRAQWNALLPPA